MAKPMPSYNYVVRRCWIKLVKRKEKQVKSLFISQKISLLYKIYNLWFSILRIFGFSDIFFRVMFLVEIYCAWKLGGVCVHYACMCVSVYKAINARYSIVILFVVQTKPSVWICRADTINRFQIWLVQYCSVSYFFYASTWYGIEIAISLLVVFIVHRKYRMWWEAAKLYNNLNTTMLFPDVERDFTDMSEIDIRFITKWHEN